MNAQEVLIRITDIRDDRLARPMAAWPQAGLTKEKQHGGNIQNNGTGGNVAGKFY